MNQSSMPVPKANQALRSTGSKAARARTSAAKTPRTAFVHPVVVEPIRSHDTEDVVRRLEHGQHSEHQPHEGEREGHGEELTLFVNLAAREGSA